MTAKVAMQLAGPPCLLLVAAALLLLKPLPSTSPTATALDLEPSLFLDTLGGFLGFWTCSCWTAFSLFALAAARLGLAGGARGQLKV